MVVENMTFRELDRKWFLLEKVKDIKRMNHLFHLKNKKYPILVYSYIDHEFGLSLRILGPIEVEEGKAFLNKKRLDKRLDIVRYSEMEKLELTPVDSKVAEQIENAIQVIEEMDSYYAPYEAIKSTREDEKLDSFRDEVVPDNIKFLMITPDHKKEFLEGKIEDYDSEKGYYHCVLLKEPKQDFNLKEGDKVVLKYVDRPNYQGLAFIKKCAKEESR